MSAPLYDAIGKSYNATRCADPRIVQKMLAHLNPVAGQRYLDLACGTGNYTLEYARSVLAFFGVDQSELMITQAKMRSSGLEWRVAAADCLPFADGYFSGITCTNAIHHFQDFAAVAQECGRVLAGGKFVIFCSTKEQMQHYWLRHYFPRMMARSIEQMPSRQSIVDGLTVAGFRHVLCEKYFVEPDLQDLFLYAGKQRPELYLNAEFRKNISSFASLANQDEVRAGVTKLAADIDSGAVAEIMASVESAAGDYLIVSAKNSPL